VLSREAEKAFNQDMIACQEEMPVIPKDKKNDQTHSSYSSYETILKWAKPIYTKYGFSVLFYEEDSSLEGNIRVSADVMHKSGHTKKVHTDIPMDDKGAKGTVNKTQTHAKGSSISYGRNYLMRMIFNIPTGDEDDGNTAGARPISTEQLESIGKEIYDSHADLEKFLKHFGIPELAYLKERDFDRAMRLLADKKSQRKAENDSNS